MILKIDFSFSEMKRMVSIITGNIFPTESRGLENLLKDSYSGRKHYILPSLEECIKNDRLGYFIMHLDILKTELTCDLTYKILNIIRYEYLKEGLRFFKYIVSSDECIYLCDNSFVIYSMICDIIVDMEAEYTKVLCRNRHCNRILLSCINQLTYVCAINIPEKVKILLEHYVISDDLVYGFSKMLLEWAFGEGDTKLLKVILSDGRIDPRVFKVRKSRRGRKRYLADKLILKIIRNNPFPIHICALECLKLLYDDERVRGSSATSTLRLMKKILDQYGL